MLHRLFFQIEMMIEAWRLRLLQRRVEKLAEKLDID